MEELIWRSCRKRCSVPKRRRVGNWSFAPGREQSLHCPAPHRAAPAPGQGLKARQINLGTKTNYTSIFYRKFSNWSGSVLIGDYYFKWNARLRVFSSQGYFSHCQDLPISSFLPPFHILLLFLLEFSGVHWYFLFLIYTTYQVDKVGSKSCLGWRIGKPGWFSFSPPKGHFWTCHCHTATTAAKALDQNKHSTFARLFVLCQSLEWPWLNYLHLNEWIYIASEG